MIAEEKKITAYFSHLATKLGSVGNVEIVAIAHMVPNTPFFISALQRMGTVAGVFAKPKTQSRDEFKQLSDKVTLSIADRNWKDTPDRFIEALYGFGLRGKSVVLIDIGGYYAPLMDFLANNFDGKILGILEGTENGVQKYEREMATPGFTPNIPVVTVARSPLKLPEDYLVASSVVFSVEAVLREQAQILQTRTAAVIGYGRVGSAVAEILRNRGINTLVHDTSPIPLALAAAKGFQACTRLETAIKNSDLVVCATGNAALELAGFGMLRSGAIVASVTSADDEFDLDSLAKGYNRREVSSNVTEYSESSQSGRSFYLIANGNAANFIHGAVIGPAIQLIEGEKLAAVRKLASTDFSPKASVQELARADRTLVSDFWNIHFLN